MLLIWCLSFIFVKRNLGITHSIISGFCIQYNNICISYMYVCVHVCVYVCMHVWLCVIVCVRHEHWMSTYWALNSSLLGWFVRAIEKAEGTKKSIGDLENQTWANHVQISHLTCVNCDIHLFCFCFCLVGQLFWITLFVWFNQSPSNVPYLYSHFSPVLNHWLCVTWISLIQIAIFPMLGFFS